MYKNQSQFEYPLAVQTPLRPHFCCPSVISLLLASKGFIFTIPAEGEAGFLTLDTTHTEITNPTLTVGHSWKQDHSTCHSTLPISLSSILPILISFIPD